MSDILSLIILVAPWVGFAGLALGWLSRRGPPPPPPVPVGGLGGEELERERLEAIKRRRDDRLDPVRDLARDSDADRRTEALTREVSR